MNLRTLHSVKKEGSHFGLGSLSGRLGGSGGVEEDPPMFHDIPRSRKSPGDPASLGLFRGAPRPHEGFKSAPR
eukprot:6990606-Pyramimonas_sp.AAC.1